MRRAGARKGGRRAATIRGSSRMVGRSAAMKKRGKAQVGEQLELEMKPKPTWGGKRDGAGRRRKKGAIPRNVRRPELSKHHPVHVSLRVVKGVGRLRRPAAYAAIRRAVAACIGRRDFRIVHTSIQ